MFTPNIRVLPETQISLFQSTLPSSAARSKWPWEVRKHHEHFTNSVVPIDHWCQSLSRTCASATCRGSGTQSLQTHWHTGAGAEPTPEFESQQSLQSALNARSSLALSFLGGVCVRNATSGTQHGAVPCYTGKIKRRDHAENVQQYPLECLSTSLPLQATRTIASK